MSQVSTPNYSDSKIVHGEDHHCLNEVYPFFLTHHFQFNSKMISLPKNIPMPVSVHFPSESIAVVNLVMKLF